MQGCQRLDIELEGHEIQTVLICSVVVHITGLLEHRTPCLSALLHRSIAHLDRYWRTYRAASEIPRDSQNAAELSQTAVWIVLC
jgi:hypothetical protein